MFLGSGLMKMTECAKWLIRLRKVLIPQTFCWICNHPFWCSPIVFQWEVDPLVPASGHRTILCLEHFLLPNHHKMLVSRLVAVSNEKIKLWLMFIAFIPQHRRIKWTFGWKLENLSSQVDISVSSVVARYLSWSNHSALHVDKNTLIPYL